MPRGRAPSCGGAAPTVRCGPRAARPRAPLARRSPSRCALSGQSPRGVCRVGDGWDGCRQLTCRSSHPDWLERLTAQLMICIPSEPTAPLAPHAISPSSQPLSVTWRFTALRSEGSRGDGPAGPSRLGWSCRADFPAAVVSSARRPPGGLSGTAGLAGMDEDSGGQQRYRAPGRPCPGGSGDNINLINLIELINYMYAKIGSCAGYASAGRRSGAARVR